VLGGVPLEVDTRKAVAMLAYLAVSGVSHRRESLAALLWPDYDQIHAMGALRRTLSSLRKALRGEFLEIKRETVGIHPLADWWLDVAEFHRLLNEGQSHGHARAQVCPRCILDLENALRLYRDHFMAGFTLRDSPEFDDWEFYQAESLRRELADVLERLVQGYAAQGNYDKAIGVARRQVSLDPLHEPAHRQLMQLYAQSGQHNAALRQYQECERILEEELGVPPLDETTRLYQMIKQRRSDETGESQVISPVAQATPLSLASRIPLVGREAEMHALQQVYARVVDDGHFLVVEGETGIGKTRLVEDMLTNLRSRGVVTIAGRCYSGQANLAYAPVVEGLRSAIQENRRPGWEQTLPALWLNEAARLLPELRRLGVGPGLEVPLDSLGAQFRFYEGLSQLLLALCGESPPGVVFIDDLQWADEATLDFLTYLARRLSARPILLLVTWSTEEVAAGHPLRRLYAEAQRSGLASALTLSRLSAEAVAELVGAVALPLSGAESRRLYRESEGLPFILAEYLAALSEDLRLKPDMAWTMPERVRHLLLSRLEKAGDAGWQLLQSAAVIGRSFDFETLREASGRTEEEAVMTLEGLLSRGLIRESQPGGEEARGGPIYDFIHDKVRSLVLSETSQTRRRLLHQRVAQALVVQARERQDRAGLAAQIATHFRQGGRAREAAEYYHLAGEYARSVHANAEALADFQAALSLGHSDTPGLDEAIAELHVLQGDYRAALSSYESASAHYQGKDPALARIEHKLGDLSSRMGEWESAERHFQAAADGLHGNGSPSALSRLYSDWSRASYHQGKTERARQLASQALELAETASDAAAEAQAYNVLGILERNQGELSQAIRHLTRSLEIAESVGDWGSQVAALNNLSLVYADNGELAQAISCTQNALKLCISLGDRHRQAALHNNLADLYHITGQREASISHLKEAVVIFAEIGASGAEESRPEIWKLTEW
jgi:DNA-binding SARP family transcriptional activator